MLVSGRVVDLPEGIEKMSGFYLWKDSRIFQLPFPAMYVSWSRPKKCLHLSFSPIENLTGFFLAIPLRSTSTRRNFGASTSTRESPELWNSAKQGANNLPNCFIRMIQKLDVKIKVTETRWWFQIFFIFIPIWGRFPFWLIFFRWVETTN